MPQPALQLDFTQPGTPIVLVAERLAEHLADGLFLKRRDVSAVLTDCFGATDAAGGWGQIEMHTAVELAQLLWLRDTSDITVRSGAVAALQAFEQLDQLLFTRTGRSEEQVALDQFSTPPMLSWAAARAAQLRPDDLILEPSAGTGQLVLWAEGAGSNLHLNEIAEKRRSALAYAFPEATLTAFDGELIDEFLGSSARPSVVLMNPPFVHGLERGYDVGTCARHVRAALRALRPGGRLVAVVPEKFDRTALTERLGFSVRVRLDARIEGAFIRMGTGVTTRLLVVDKSEADARPCCLDAPNFENLIAAVDALPARAPLKSPAPRLLPVIAPLRPMPVRTLVPPQSRAIAASADLAFEMLAAPARLDEQVGIYLPYRPSRITIPSAVRHPTALVESLAMGSITAPRPMARPRLTAGLVEKGALSDAQLETLIYAADAFTRDLPGRYAPLDGGCSLTPQEDGMLYRQGFFLGDGTGAGKGRQVASVFLDCWLHGNRRHIWISKNETLLEDARRDWAALGGIALDIQPLSNWKPGTPITLPEGILFTTYPTLRSGRAETTRLEQILDWAGADFEGVIAFDEAHAMANAAGGEGSRGKAKGSEQGIAGVRLQNMLPRARVIYVSATGASDVNNLAYATRLGLWGPETAFESRERFVADIRAGGIAAMELVARDLKALGLYVARALSFAGVEYDVLEHALTPEQIAIYDAYAGAWAIIHANLREVLEATRVVDEANGATLNAGAKSAALSVFEGTKQRFFAQLLLSMKLPSLLPAVDAALGQGHAVVVQLVSTSEAMLDRRLADLDAAERASLTIDLSPREYVVDYLVKSFPTRMMQVFTDENGDPRSQPMSDADGNPVLCQRALAARDSLIEQLCALPPIAVALDAIIERFGVDAVAEVTGRTRRLVIGPDGTQRVDARPASSNVAETAAFMDGRKRILIFSDAGGTGRSYHADLNVRNQARRVHFLLEPGWRADAAIQGLGRTNRTNQASAPLFRPVTTDVRGERRFISTIARRLDTLGALTRGQRQTGGQNLFDPADNLESCYAKEALNRWFGLLCAGKLSAVTLGRFEQLTGLTLTGPDGGMIDDLPPIQRWLNRILALPIGLQNAIFDEYLALVEARVDAARQAGTLDLGVETVAVESFDIFHDRVLRTDPSGATTHLLEVEIAHVVRPLTAERLDRFHGIDAPRHIPMRNARSGRVALVVPATRLMTDEGAIIERVELIRPLARDYMTRDALDESSWEPVAKPIFLADWAAECAAAEGLKRERLQLATGLLLPIWDKLPADHVRVTRLVASDGRSLIGREVPVGEVAALGTALALDIDLSLSPQDLGALVLKAGKPMPLKGPEALHVRRSLVNGQQRLELTGFSAGRLDWYKAQGCLTEIIRYQTRLFVPVDDFAPVLGRIQR